MFKDKNIIIVEDNEINIYFLKTILNNTQAKVTYCTNADEFFNEYDSTYDIVLLDIMIPGDMNGIDILKKLRSTNKEIPILMQSAYTEKIKDCINEGANEFLEKPITYTYMLKMLKKYLLDEGEDNKK